MVCFKLDFIKLKLYQFCSRSGNNWSSHWTFLWKLFIGKWLRDQEVSSQIYFTSQSDGWKALHLCDSRGPSLKHHQLVGKEWNFLAKNKTEVATQMVIHNIPHWFQETKPIHMDCVSDPSTLNWGALELHDVKYSGISALPLHGRWGKMIMAWFRGADISPQEARASLSGQTFLNHHTAKGVGRW